MRSVIVVKKALGRHSAWSGLCCLALLAVLLLAGCDSGTPAKTRSTPSGATGISSGVWLPLAGKPLHLPTLTAGAACPVTPAQAHVSPDFALAAGSGPIYVVMHDTHSILTYSAAGIFDSGSAWGGAKVYWQIKPGYQGPVLIRGQQLNGPNALRFNGGLGQTHGNPQGTEPLLPDLQLMGGQATGASWPTWETFTRIQTPGCYAYQVDSTGFSEVIVFQAVAG